MASIRLPEKTRVAIYVRVSTVHQVDKDSLPMQKQDLMSYAHLMLGTDDCVVFEDAGYSGKNTDRPEFQEMMKQIRAGAFTHLLVWKIDRISRNLLDFATMYKELKDLGVVFVSKNEQFDTSTAMGEAMLKIILVFAELERNMTSERVTATMISRASNGQWNGGRVPYGYDYNPDNQEFSINESEAAVVRIIHDRYEQDKSLVSLARYLNGIGYRSRAGNDWSPVSLLIILRNVFYCGDYRYNVLKEGDRQRPKPKSEWVTVENHHAPIVSREQKERITAILDSNRRIRERGQIANRNKHVHIFAGLIRCGNCGKMYNSSVTAEKASGWKYTTYYCPTKRKHETVCTGKSTSDPVIGQFVFNYILNMLNAQKDFQDISSPAELQKALLSGMAFQHIERIEQQGLDDMYSLLSTGISPDAYVTDKDIVGIENTESELPGLIAEKAKTERALDRLRNLYLYADADMPEREYFTQRAKLESQLADINEQIGMINSDEWDRTVTDAEFVRRASDFILGQKLNGRASIDFKRLAMTIAPETLRSFIISVVDNITVLDGKVSSIVFRNGLTHKFIFRQ